jgi:hypothetical protein
MPKKGYNYNFKMMMEGIEVPFQSANIICSPNGVEASINCHSNEELLELKPKTAIQILYKDWCGNEAPGWHLLCDTFLSRFDKNEDASGGIGIAVQARDFRMDIRKAPAALSYNDAQDISGGTYYHTAGLFQTVTYQLDNGHYSTATRTFDNSRLNDLADRVVMIARTATGGLAVDKGAISTKAGSYYDKFMNCFPQAITNTKEGRSELDGNANGGFFLDAFVRGIWMDAAGGTKIGTYLNKRIRVDKRFMIPVNAAGYNMWKVNNLGQLTGEAAMADSQFGCIEAIIMRIAALFMVRVYSCNTPNLISLADNSTAAPFIIDNTIRTFCTKMASKEFGPPYLLNSSMLLPPLEFTAPPDCNLIFPCMYHRVIWQYDMDAEITRGYFTATDCFGTEDSPLSIKWGYQVPNGLFQMPQTTKNGKQVNTKPQEYKASRLTLEERYKGVNVMTGTVEEHVAYRELSNIWQHKGLTSAAAKKLDAEMKKYQNAVNDANNPTTDKKWIAAEKAKIAQLSAAATAEVVSNLKKFVDQKTSDKANNLKEHTNYTDVLKHHALIKFINTRYAGRVITVEMSFNPYLIAGFPGIVIADDHGDGFKTLKSMIGMIQQVKHFITRDGEAVSSVVMNNVRFIDEPADIDENGNPLYCKATDPVNAIVNEDLIYLKEANKFQVSAESMYMVGAGKPLVQYNFSNSEYLDLEKTTNNQDYKYAKDFLAISLEDLSNGKVNGMYMDRIYEPNRISIFYKAVFGQHSNFMTNSYLLGDGNTYKYMFDSIHEAIENLTTNHKELLVDYESSLNYIKRDVCCEEGFYCGILGLSIPEMPNASHSDLEYIVKTGLTPNDQFDKTASHPEYFGVSSSEFYQLPAEILEKTITKPGMCSSIIESSPRTAFIEERKDAVRTYLKSVLNQVEAVSYTNE